MTCLVGFLAHSFDQLHVVTSGHERPLPEDPIAKLLELDKVTRKPRIGVSQYDRTSRQFKGLGDEPVQHSYHVGFEFKAVWDLFDAFPKPVLGVFHRV